MYAQVILNTRTRVLDRPLDYKIPEDIILNIGDSVIVPFGFKNKPTQAYVISVSETVSIDESKIKYIKRKAPTGTVFDGKMLEIIRFMREKYLCTYSEAINAVVPSGISVKSREWLSVCSMDNLKGRKKEIADAVYDAGGSILYDKLKTMFEYDCSSIVTELVKTGNLERTFSEGAPVNKKTLTAVTLNVTPEEAEILSVQLSKKAPKQAKALSVMVQAKTLTSGDLQQYSDCGASAVKSLCEKGILRKTVVESDRNPNNTYVKPDTAKNLTDEQKNVCNTINSYIKSGVNESFLLHGVTGSGKTEVYMQCIKESLDAGKKAIVLVPEISLTPQTVNRFRARFGDRVAVFHSALSPGEKYDQWRKMRAGDVDIVIGARSAIFAPFDNIGIIILDEEHSETYKSESAPRYVTSEVAGLRAKQHGAVLILASATPSFETYYKAQQGKLKLVTLTSRFNKNSMPDISVIDMRKELQDGNKSMFSRRLAEEIKINLERGEQTILFLNRRGFSTFVSCRECGYVVHCPNCNISLTYHKTNDTLQCHYCGHTVKNYTLCPSCGSKYIRYFGTGTQKVEDEVKKMFPEASTLRMDIDTTGKKQSHQTILDKFEKEKTDILIGTQMVTKGLDFENVTLVGVISADTMLNTNDFRSGERTFNILEQVTGRAGRGSKRGRAVIQTYSPEHEAIIMASHHNYIKYYNDEIRMRKILWYPPFCDIILIGFSGESKQFVEDCSKHFRMYLGKGDFTVLGPLPCAVSKIKNKHRYQILIKCDNSINLTERILYARNRCMENANYSKINIVIDKNPIHIS